MLKGSIEDHGRWTHYSEKFFILLEDTYLQHSKGSVPSVTRQPRNRQGWKSKLRGTIEIRKALLRVEEAVQKVI